MELLSIHTDGKPETVFNKGLNYLKTTYGDTIRTAGLTITVRNLVSNGYQKIPRTIGKTL